MNAMIVRLGGMLDSDLPICLLDSMRHAVPYIWYAAGRTRIKELDSERHNVNDLISFAQDRFYEGVFFAGLDRLTEEQQKRLSTCLLKFDSPAKGKLIFTAERMDKISPELIICRINFQFHYAGSNYLSSLIY